MKACFLRRLSIGWKLTALGLVLGVGGTCLFFRPEIESISFSRVIQFKLFWLLILAGAFLPPLVFEMLGGIRVWRNLQHLKQEAERSAPSAPDKPPV